jgi:hypothetical protein
MDPNQPVKMVPQTLMHGDFRRENIMFVKRPNEERSIVFIDFQLLRWGWGEWDIAYFVWGSMATPKEDWKEVLEGYYKYVTENFGGEAPYSWEECQFHFWCGVINVSLVINLIAVSSLDFKNELGAALIKETTPRLIASFDFFDPEATIDAMLDPETFKDGKFQEAALAKIIRY